MPVERGVGQRLPRGPDLRDARVEALVRPEARVDEGERGPAVLGDKRGVPGRAVARHDGARERLPKRRLRACERVTRGASALGEEDDGDDRVRGAVDAIALQDRLVRLETFTPRYRECLREGVRCAVEVGDPAHEHGEPEPENEEAVAEHDPGERRHVRDVVQVMSKLCARSVAVARATVARYDCVVRAGLPEAGTTKAHLCAAPRATAAQTNKVARALRAPHDLWGNQLLNAPDGPSYAAAQRLLPPLFYARAPKKRPLTESGAYYLTFGQPHGARGAGSVALHVADGSQVIAERVGGRRLTVFVGAAGRERFGSCLSRLGFARLADGYLPVLTTTYRDGAGVRYRQEAFAAHTSETGSLVSFVRFDVDASRASRKLVQLRIATSVRQLRRSLAFSRGGTVKRSTLTYRIRRGTKRTLYLAWINYPGRRGISVDADRYDRARRAVQAFWRRRVAEGTQIVVPERRINDAYRNLLVQNLQQTWRYSVGNPYEQFSFPESVDVAEV